MKLIAVSPEILQAGSCSSGKSEDRDVRVILSGAVPQTQPALSLKKSYERDRERLENRYLRAKLKFKREIRSGVGGKCQGFSGEHTGESRHYLLWLFRDIRLSPPTLCASKPQTEAKKYTCLLHISGSIAFTIQMLQPPNLHHLRVSVQRSKRAKHDKHPPLPPKRHAKEIAKSC